MPLATINSVWIGPRLGPVHAACLRSFVRHGHRTVLHAYEPPADLPEGVELADADALLPASRMIHHRSSGSVAIFADLLRYEIQKQRLGLYVDCDCYCLRPMEDADHIYGFESADLINNAVLKLPGDCPVVDALCRLKDENAFIPPWAPFGRRAYYRWRAWLGKPVEIQDMPWGYTGPHALTWYVHQYGLERQASPIEDFYPVRYNQTSLLLDPNLTIGDITTPRTRLLHLSNGRLGKATLAQVPPSSPLGVILAS